MTRRKRSDPISNVYVEDSGRLYRICFHYNRVILIALKGKKRERVINVDGRRAKYLLKRFNHNVPQELIT